jgi:hypothetical protein
VDLFSPKPWLWAMLFKAVMTWCVHNDIVCTASSLVLIVKTGRQLVTWCIHNNLVHTASKFRSHC